MFNPNPRRPLTRRQTARIVFAGVILAWATQILIQQWGYGAEVPLAMLQNETVERFVPPVSPRSARMELRAEATIVGQDVKLRQVARWSQEDAAVFAPVADLVLANVGPRAPFRSISLDEVKSTLRDAGVNLASLHFVGATTCVVSRSDVEYDERTALSQWIDARSAGKEPQPTNESTGTGTEPAPAADILALATDSNLSTTIRVDAPADEPVAQNLRNLLLTDLCERLNLRRDQLQVTFRPADDKVLALAEAQFEFQVEPVRVRDLGEVAWNVTIRSGETTQRASIIANARAWQTQIVAARPVAFRQMIGEDDIVERPTLADKLDQSGLLAKAQAVGQQASRDLKAGTVLTTKMIDPVALVRPGQLVTVTIEQGNIQVKTVGRALEGGAFGQAIRVRNETTREIFQVTITGAQTAAVGASPVAQGR